MNDYYEADEIESAGLDQLEGDSKEIPDGWEKVGIRKEWVTVQPFLTREGAQKYIDANHHNLNTGVRIYACSGYRNYHWQLLRELFLSASEYENE